MVYTWLLWFLAIVLKTTGYAFLKIYVQAQCLNRKSPYSNIVTKNH
jgi:hypothetical protein